MPRNRLRVCTARTASVACKNWHPDTTSGTYLPQNTREASYAIFPIRTTAEELGQLGWRIQTTNKYMFQLI